MKYGLLLLALLLLPIQVLAYDPSPEDRDIINAAEKRFETLFPDDIDQLIDIYTQLRTQKVAMKVRGGDRGVYIREEIMDELQKLLFRQSEVCTAPYIQWGDNVEVRYIVQNDEGSTLRQHKDLLAFNPGKNAPFLALERSVLGQSLHNRTNRWIPTTRVTAGTGEDLQKTVSRTQVEQDAVPLYLGHEYAFGIDDMDRMVIGTVVDLTDEEVTFDFTDATNDEQVILSVTIKNIVKACR